MKTIAHITVIGRDKTGVVAKITQFLFQTGANIEEIDQQVTRGRFSMSLQASWEGKPSPSQISNGLENLNSKLKMEIRLRWVSHQIRQRMALFVTKEPECPEAVIQAVRSGKIPAEIQLMVGNHTHLKGLSRKIKASFLYVDYRDRLQSERKILEALEEHGIDWIVLARFMKILSPDFVWRFKNKIINIHPSLLPAFPGASAYRQAYERGVKIVGVSAHLVTMDLDEGPIICQDSFKIRPQETLAQIVKRGQKLEAKTLVKAVSLCLKKRLDVHWGVVHNV